MCECIFDVSRTSTTKRAHSHRLYDPNNNERSIFLMRTKLKKPLLSYKNTHEKKIQNILKKPDCSRGNPSTVYYTYYIDSLCLLHFGWCRFFGGCCCCFCRLCFGTFFIWCAQWLTCKWFNFSRTISINTIITTLIVSLCHANWCFMPMLSQLAE